MGPSAGVPGTAARKGLWKGIGGRSGPCKDVFATPCAGRTSGAWRIASTSTRFSGQATPGDERVGRDGEVRIRGGLSGFDGFRRNENMIE